MCPAHRARLRTAPVRAPAARTPRAPPAVPAYRARARSPARPPAHSPALLVVRSPALLLTCMSSCSPARPPPCSSARPLVPLCAHTCPTRLLPAPLRPRAIALYFPRPYLASESPATRAPRSTLRPLSRVPLVLPLPSAVPPYLTSHIPRPTSYGSRSPPCAIRPASHVLHPALQVSRPSIAAHRAPFAPLSTIPVSISIGHTDIPFPPFTHPCTAVLSFPRYVARRHLCSG